MENLISELWVLKRHLVSVFIAKIKEGISREELDADFDNLVQELDAINAVIEIAMSNDVF